jgi:hypothetical protein
LVESPADTVREFGAAGKYNLLPEIDYSKLGFGI